MNLIANFLSKRLPLFIIIIAVGTYFSPIYLEVSPLVPSILLGIVIFFTGLSMNIESIKNIRNKTRELFLATIFKWTFTVFISISLAYLFFSSKPEIAAGLVLAGTVPNATAATVYTFLAGGNTSLVIAASLVDIVISPIIAPIAMLGILSEQVSISIFSLLKAFLVIVVLPLFLGLSVKRIFPWFATYSRNVTKLGSTTALLLIVHTLVGSGKFALSSEISILPLLAFATLIQVIFPMATTYLIAKKLNVDEEDARAMLFHAGLCNTALAAILAFKFIGEIAAIAPIMNMIFNLSIGAFISNHFAKTNINLPVSTPEISKNTT